MGHRKIGTDLSNEHLEQLLENGRNIRKSKAYPIKCRLKLDRFWRILSDNSCLMHNVRQSGVIQVLYQCLLISDTGILTMQ